MRTLEKIKAHIAAAAADADKFYNRGNKTAGTRLRNAMQQLKVLAQQVRTEVAEQKRKAQ